MPEKILLVDDEQNVLDGYRRTLRKNFKIQTALSGREGLETLDQEGPFAVVVSDMKMPEMDGVQFLSSVKRQHPDAVRIMLTGNADQETAIGAINDGDVFRFLNKPCPAEEMGSVLNAALDKYRNDTVEKRLLQETLNGAIKALLDILSITYPEVFGQSASIVNYAKKCAEFMSVETNWELETSARLCQVGMVVLPKEIVEKILKGSPLSDDEKRAYIKFPESGAKLIENIPRMESVGKNVRYLLKRFDGSGFPRDEVAGNEIPTVSRILAPILEYKRLLYAGIEPSSAMTKIESAQSRYDLEVLTALRKVFESEDTREIVEVTVERLGTNMYLAEDLKTDSGMMLVAKNQHISESLADKLINFCQSGALKEKIQVYLEGESTPFR